MSVKPIPDGYSTVTPYIVVKETNKLLTFLEEAFNAKREEVIEGPDGQVKHAVVKIGDSMVMMGQSREGSDKTNVMLYLYVEDTDATYKKALDAGAKSLLEPVDQFYGDRNAGVEGPCGNRWWIATHVEDVSSEELQKRSQAHHKQA
jgi:PhnB protein